MDRIQELILTYKLPFFLTLFGGVLLLGGLYSNFSRFNENKDFAANFNKNSIVSSDNISDSIKVDVSGAVKKPGVYALSKNSRIEDALKIAGGLDDEFNKEYLAKKLNLSQKLSDGSKIYVPFSSESTSNLGTIAFNSQGISVSLIGINSSDQKMLESLPGVGEVTAQKIISARPFSSLEELINKKVISRSVFEKIKAQIDLN